jgi:dihydroorotate dehydrogenase (fumarate)
VAMVTSAILKNGIEHMETMLADLRAWMEEHEYESIRQMQGSMSRQAVADPTAFSRANYLKVLSSYAVRSATQ